MKARWPGWVTGKLSDVAGLAFFPLLLLVGVAAVAPHALARRPRASLAACIASTALVFALVKTVPAATHAYALALGALQWPFRAAAALVEHAAMPPLARAFAVTDPTDLLALPFVLVSWWLHASHARKSARAAASGVAPLAAAHARASRDARGA